MDIGQERPGVRIGEFGGGKEVGTEREGRAARQGTHKKLAARNGWQMNWHHPFLRVPGVSLKSKL
jgi:hypothetical protein